MVCKLEKMAEKGEFSNGGNAFANPEEETKSLTTGLLDNLREERGSGDMQPRALSPSARHPIRVLTADDQEIVLNGIRLILQNVDDTEMVGEGSCGAHTVRLCDKPKLDVMLMGLGMLNMDSVATKRSIRRRCPDTKVLVVTLYDSIEFVKEDMQAGAVGDVKKYTSRDELASAIRAALEGRTALSLEAAKNLVAKSTTPTTVINDDLTDRERHVLGLLAKGMRNKEIAEQINKSPYTVRHYVSELTAKLGASNRTEAAVIAVKQGLIE